MAQSAGVIEAVEPISEKLSVSLVRETVSPFDQNICAQNPAPLWECGQDAPVYGAGADALDTVGPPGPPGPPGTPADMTLVYALQQKMATQQAQIDALRGTLNRILSLPGIEQRLNR
jgi:hypothetical protein